MRISDWSSDVCSSDLLIMTMQPSSLSDGARRARLTHLLHRAAHMRRQTFDARLRPFGITAVQYWVLGRLARTNDSGLTQTELARALESGKVSVGALVTRLEAPGLVERRVDSRDRRIPLGKASGREREWE